MRGTLPRLRQDQLMNFAWKFALPFTLLNLLVTALWRFMGEGWLRWVVCTVILGAASCSWAAWECARGTSAPGATAMLSRSIASAMRTIIFYLLAATHAGRRLWQPYCSRTLSTARLR